MGRLIACCVAVLLALAAPASARHHGQPGIDHLIQPDGFGMLIASPFGHPVSWERCAADGSSCAPHDDGDGDDQYLHVRESDPVGSVFKATQDGVTAASDPWRGRVRSTRPPSVEGEYRVGGWVKPVAGEWEGGWGREGDALQLQACLSADGSNCKVILDSDYVRCRPDTSRVLPARYTGWWLKVVDARVIVPRILPSIGYGRPELITPWPAAPANAAVVAGRIERGPRPAEDCGWAPRVIVNGVIGPGADRRLVAVEVVCPERCRMQLVLRQGPRRVSLTRRLAPGAVRKVAIPPRDARRLRSGPATVTVFLDGHPDPVAVHESRLELQA